MGTRGLRMRRASAHHPGGYRPRRSCPDGVAQPLLGVVACGRRYVQHAAPAEPHEAQGWGQPGRVSVGQHHAMRNVRPDGRLPRLAGILVH